MSENDIPRLSPAIETNESIEIAQPIHSETAPTLTSNASPASPQVSEASEASDVSTSILDNVESEDQSFADILKLIEEVIEPQEEPSSEKALDTMEIEPKETPHVVLSPPTRTDTVPQLYPEINFIDLEAEKPAIYGTLKCKSPSLSQCSFLIASLTLVHQVVDPALRWQSGSSIYEIKKKTIIIGKFTSFLIIDATSHVLFALVHVLISTLKGRTRASDSNLDVNMEGITENAKFVSHEHLKVTITNTGFMLSESIPIPNVYFPHQHQSFFFLRVLAVLGRNPVSVDGKDYSKVSGPYVSTKNRCIFVLGKTELLLIINR